MTTVWGWPGWHPKGRLYFSLTTNTPCRQVYNKSWYVFTNSSCEMTQITSFYLLHFVNQVFCFQGILFHMHSDYSTNFIFFLSNFGRMLQGQPSVLSYLSSNSQTVAKSHIPEHCLLILLLNSCLISQWPHCPKTSCFMLIWLLAHLHALDCFFQDYIDIGYIYYTHRMDAWQ